MEDYVDVVLRIDMGRVRQKDIVTHRNKTDEEYGVQMIAPSFKYGRVRLPGRGPSRGYSMKLVDEVTRYPQASTTDLTMSTWFGQYQMQYLALPATISVKSHRPSWLGRAS